MITIDGNISSGKSTLIDILKKHFKNDPTISFVREPVDIWESFKQDNLTLLQLFYSNRERYSFPFQIAALTSRCKLLSSVDQSTKSISERSIYTDREVFANMLHEDKFISDVELDIYLSVFEAFQDKCQIRKCIYVRSDPKVCYQRVNVRKRDGEECINLEYLKRVHDFHERFYNNFLSKYKCLVIDNNFDINSPEYEANVKKIIQFIQE